MPTVMSGLPNSQEEQDGFSYNITPLMNNGQTIKMRNFQLFSNQVNDNKQKMGMTDQIGQNQQLNCFENLFTVDNMFPNDNEEGDD